MLLKDLISDFDFIWEGKPEKIKREILIQDYEKGGLKMINLEMFIMSLKISWLKRISVSENNRTINYIYLEKLKHMSGKLFFECNLSPDDVNSIVKKKNTFINEILTTWCKCNIKKSILSYRNEIMWNNYDIKVGGKTIFYANWYQNGITFIRDIYYDTGKHSYPFSQLKEMYNLPESDFLKYLSLDLGNKNKNENINIPETPNLFSQILNRK